MSSPSRSRSFPGSMWMRAIPVLPLLCTIALCCSPGIALAQSFEIEEESREAAAEHSRRGRRLYNLGWFQAALEAYSRAYEIYEAPGLLFNIGQCFRHLGDHRRAVFSYERYLRDAPDATNRALVEELIAESREALENGNASTDEVEQVAGVAPADDAADRVAADTQANVEVGQTEEEGSEEARGRARLHRRWWFWTVVGALVIGAGVGTYFLVRPGEATIVPPSGSLGTIDRR